MKAETIYYDADGCVLFQIQTENAPYPSWGRPNDCPAVIAAGTEIEHCNDEIAFMERPDPQKVQVMLDFWDRQREYRLQAAFPKEFAFLDRSEGS